MPQCDIVVGCFSKYSFDDIRPWVNSLEECGFKGTKLVLHAEASPETIEELKSRGFYTVEVQLFQTDMHSIARDRYFHLWKVLKDLDNVRFVLMTDMKDVVFQTNPIDWLEANLGPERLVAVSECVKHKDESWNREAMKAAYGAEVYEAMSDKMVYCSGVLAGYCEDFAEFCLQVYLLSTGRCGPYGSYIDQAAVNILIHLSPYRNIFFLSRSRDGFACHAQVSCITKDRTTLQEPEPVYNDGWVRTCDGLTYSILHQYTRIPEWKKTIEKRYCDGRKMGFRQSSSQEEVVQNQL